MSQPNSPTPPKEKGGIVSSIAMLIGGLLALFSFLGVLNTALGWDIRIKGSALPKHWGEALGLVGVTAVFWAIWAFLTYVGPVRRFGQKRPWVMALIVVLGLVGLIVGITIWDNGNIKARDEAWEAEAIADSLDHIADNKAMFGDKPVPYRLAVLNPETTPVEVYVDSQLVATIPGLQGTQLDLPWQSAKVAVKKDGKKLGGLKINPDSTKATDPAALHVFSPGEKLDVWVFDYGDAYVGGKLQPSPEFESDDLKSYINESFFVVDKGGPFFVMPNQKAPETSPYHVYRLVLMPMSVDEPSEYRPFARWMMRRVDTRPADAPSENVADLYKIWKAEQ